VPAFASKKSIWPNSAQHNQFNVRDAICKVETHAVVLIAREPMAQQGHDLTQMANIRNKK
jgi:hypothetical protein